MLQKIILILFSLNQICFSQALSDQTFYTIEKPKNSGEEIFLETDRQFYCIDERIYFTAGYQFNHPVENVQWSKVIYVELIRWNGDRIAQSKCKLNENCGSGYLAIPKTLISGNYYLRAYTKWMRNFPVEDYAYKLIKIINPFESNIDAGPAQEPDHSLVQLKPAKGGSYNGIECFTDKSIYKQREKVELTVRLENHDNEFSNYCVSIAKAAHLDTNTFRIQIPDKISTIEKSLIYLPETRGISISGKILQANTPISVANATVHLSTPQNWEYYTTFQTKDKGWFNFTLPNFYGQYDFYIDAVLENGESAEILVDNDYCNRNVHLTYFPFALDSMEKKIALEMVVNMQLSNMYNEESRIQTIESMQLPFYGTPMHVYYTREYITLPNLEEFFYELVNEVRTIRDKNQTYLKLVRYSQYQKLKPLILLDNIPVSSVDEFLKIPLEIIEKIEIFDKPYMVTGRIYSGIICVSTKKKDFAGIKLNKNGQFFSYKLLSEGNFTMSDYSSTDTNKLTYRHNLLFWDPDIELNQNHPQTLSFYTSDSKGEYIVYIRSINAKGTPQLFGTCKILVE